MSVGVFQGIYNESGILAAQARSLVQFNRNGYPVVDKENINGRGGGGGS